MDWDIQKKGLLEFWDNETRDIYIYIYIYIYVYVYVNPFDYRFDSEEWWFEHSMSQSWVCLSAEGAKNVLWPWLSPLRGWHSLTMTFTGKFVYIYIYI